MSSLEPKPDPILLLLSVEGNSLTEAYRPTDLAVRNPLAGLSKGLFGGEEMLYSLYNLDPFQIFRSEGPSSLITSSQAARILERNCWRASRSARVRKL